MTRDRPKRGRAEGREMVDSSPKKRKMKRKRKGSGGKGEG
jgi:hypothetical protein